jgi:hypothetical protein
MQFDNSKSGDHLERGRSGRAAVVANIPERQGVTGHHVRNVLFIGVAAIVATLAIILISFFS